MKQLLANGQGRFYTPGKLVARRHAAFIRASLRPDRNRNLRSVKPDVKAVSYKALLQDIAKSAASQKDQAGSLTSCFEVTKPSSSIGARPLSSNGSPAWSDLSYDTRRLSRTGLFSPASFETTSTETTHASAYDDDAWSTYVKAMTTPNSNTDITIQRDSTVLSPSRMYKVLEALPRRTSLSSSFVSDLLSLIDRRLSLSTFTSSRCSVSAASIAETELSYAKSKAAEVIEAVCGTVIKANLALIQLCCGTSTDCRHKLISKISETDPHLVRQHQASLDAKLTATPVCQPPRDSYGNSELFFAARVGTVPDIILSLLCVTDDVNAVNADGQTFLYFLNPQYFSSQGSPCSCLEIEMHRSRFECLILALERRRYNFDHLDNHGRHFLTFLCASPYFDIRWLLDLMLYDNEWEERVRGTSQLRDVGGTFLIDFMVLNPEFNSIDERLKSHFRPLFSFSPHLADQFDVLHNEDKQGRSRFHQYVQGDWLQEASLDELPWPFVGGLPPETALDINRYDGHGRTPIMDFLLRAFDQSLAEDFICAKVKVLLSRGANVNARSRGGSTILHFAAKKALPKLLEILLGTDIQVDHRDEAGMSALDYAAKVLQRSRSAKSRVEVMARSLKTTAHLLKVTSQTKPKDRITADQGFSKAIHGRIQSTVEQLSSTGEQKYPPSFPIGFPRRRE